MKVRILTYMIISILILATGCDKDNPVIEPDLSIIGEWSFEYELLSDGTKKYDNPYALLEFNYSDGFILNQDNTGHSVWFDKMNGDFEWTTHDSKLIISVTRTDNSLDNFEYQITNLNENSMEFETPKRHKYLMIKQ